MFFTDTITRPASHGPRRTSLKSRLSLWRTRRALAKLDAAGLADVGISPDNARHEASLTIWDVPDSWKTR